MKTHHHTAACGHLKSATACAEQGDHDGAMSHIGRALGTLKSARKDASASNTQPLAKAPQFAQRLGTLNAGRKK